MSTDRVLQDWIAGTYYALPEGWTVSTSHAQFPPKGRKLDGEVRLSDGRLISVYEQVGDDYSVRLVVWAARP